MVYKSFSRDSFMQYEGTSWVIAKKYHSIDSADKWFSASIRKKIKLPINYEKNLFSLFLLEIKILFSKFQKLLDHLHYSWLNTVFFFKMRNWLYIPKLVLIFVRNMIDVNHSAPLLQLYIVPIWLFVEKLKENLLKYFVIN